MAPPRPRITHVFTVHTTKPDDVGAVEIVFDDERAARTYAGERSRDLRVLSASITRFTLGQLGTRHPITWFVDGVEQPRHYDRQLYPGDGADHAFDHRRQRGHHAGDETSPNIDG